MREVEPSSPQAVTPVSPAPASPEGGHPTGETETAPSRALEPQQTPGDPARRIREKLKERLGQQKVLPADVPAGTGAEAQEDLGKQIRRLRTLGESVQEKKGAGSATYVPNQVLILLSISDPGTIDRAVKDLERRHALRAKRKAELSSIAMILVLLEIPDARTVSQVIGGLSREPLVRSAQPNFLYATQALYNDRHAGLQYGPARIGVDRVHPHATGQGIRVAVIDTGVDDRHPDLRGRVVERVSVVDGDGSFVEDIHGTVIAGIIAANANNALGIYGVAPSAELIAIKACVPDPPGALAAVCTSETVARGIDVALVRRTKVINLSLGGPQDPLIEHLVNRAVEVGALIVAAVGNGGPESPPLYPAALDPVIAVTATDFNDELYRLSNNGGYVDLAAPGVEILSTTPGGRFGFFSGTSMAAAHVSGVMALLLQLSPGAAPGALRALVESTARDLGPPGRDDRFGWGRIEACRAFEQIAGRRDICR